MLKIDVGLKTGDGPLLKGTCHCGAAGWTLDQTPEAATTCNCTICRRYGVIWAYGYIGHNIQTTGQTNTYRRSASGDGDIDFHFCATCGCVTHYVATTTNEDSRYWTAVNLRMSDPVPINDIPINHFEGHESFKDLPRDGKAIRDVWF
jgi:hypothetical protein